MKSCGMTDKGLVRENNEDFYIADDDLGLYIVADGLGGEESGEVASRIAAESIAAFFREGDKTRAKAVNREVIDEAILKAHQAIQETSLRTISAVTMGTTVVFALKQPSYFWIANVGDSRGYLLHRKKIEMVTRDHSLVARFVDEGHITPNEARTHYLRNIVTQALGVDLEEGCYKRELDVQEGDIIILCSDGLWDMLADEEIKKIVLRTKDFDKVCRELVKAANLAGGRDNITVVAVKV